MVHQDGRIWGNHHSDAPSLLAMEQFAKSIDAPPSLAKEQFAKSESAG